MRDLARALAGPEPFADINTVMRAHRSRPMQAPVIDVGEPLKADIRPYTPFIQEIEPPQLPEQPPIPQTDLPQTQRRRAGLPDPMEEADFGSPQYQALEDSVAGPMITSPGKVSENFRAEEFACKGTGQIKIDPRLVSGLERLRKILGRPITITSGYRTPEHNRRVKGAPNSRHMTGEAADISVPGMSPAQVAEAARKAGFGGVSAYGGHVHVDVGPERTW